MQMGKWSKARKYFDKVQETHAEIVREKGETPPPPIGGLTGFRLGDFLLCRAEISLGNWDPTGEYLKNELVERETAGRDLQSVIQEVDRYLKGSAETMSRQDRVLHEFLRVRTRAIENILLKVKGDPDVQKNIDRALVGLYADFQSYARGDVPRLLVKRSKVLRRFRKFGVDEVEGDDPEVKGDDPLVVAMDCLDEAADVASYGEMEVSLRRTSNWRGRRSSSRKLSTPTRSSVRPPSPGN